MKTDQLAAMLAAGAGPVAQNRNARGYGPALAWGALAALLVMGALLGVRADLAEAVRLPMFWVKLGFAGTLAVAALAAALRLSLPGARMGWVPAGIAIPIVAMWGFAAVVLARADAPVRAALFFGETWKVCPFLIALLSVPVFVAVFRSMANLAPTRLPLAGAIAGLLSGATAALVYCLHCPEMEAPFVAFWYLIGMLIPAGVGALAGPRWLRW